MVNPQVDYAPWIAPYERLRAGGFFTHEQISIPNSVNQRGGLSPGDFWNIWERYKIYGGWVIYTHLMLRWSKFVSEVYGPEVGASFFTAIANRYVIDSATPSTPEVRTAWIREAVAGHLFSSMSSMPDLLATNLRNPAPDQVQKQEVRWISLIIASFNQIEPWLRKRTREDATPGQQLDGLILSLEAVPRSNPLHWFLDYDWVSEEKGGSIRHPQPVDVSNTISLTQVPRHRESERLFFLNLNHMGDEWIPHMAVDVRMNGQLLGGAVYLPESVAEKMLADISLLREAFRVYRPKAN